MARRTQRRSGDLSALKVEVWASIKYLSATIDDPELSREVRLRACSAMAQCGGVYRSLLESSDFAQQLAAMQARLEVIEASDVETNHHATTP